MKTITLFNKMDSIIKVEQAKHEFSIMHNHIFFVSTKVYHQIEKYYDLDMTDIRALQYRGYTLYKFNGMGDEYICFGEVHTIV